MEDLVVTLESGSKTSSGTIADKKSQIAPPNSAPRIELLRRQQILRLVDAQPADRYEAIKRFIDIAGVEKPEEALRQSIKALAEQRNQARALEGENLSTLQSFFEAAGKPPKMNPVSWAKHTLSTPVEGVDADITAIETLRKRYAALEAVSERFGLRGEELIAAQIAVDAAEADLSAAIAKATQGDVETLPVLEAGQAFLYAHPETIECPLCLSKDKAKGLAKAVADRLGALAALRHANDKCREAERKLEAALAAHGQVADDFAFAQDAYLAVLSSHEWRTGLSLPVTGSG